MTAIVPVEQREVGGELVQAVDARELWQFLDVETPFDKWISRRVDQYEFQPGRDFSTVLSESSGGRPATQYHLTLDMAKELSMVERNARGKQARQYFIECERQAKAAAQPKALSLDDPEFLRQALLGYTEKVIELQQQVEEMSPKAAFHDELVSMDGLIDLRQAAKATPAAVSLRHLQRGQAGTSIGLRQIPTSAEQPLPDHPGRTSSSWTGPTSSRSSRHSRRPPQGRRPRS